MKDLKANIEDKYIKAFISVAQMLAEDVEFTDVYETKHTDFDGCTERDIKVVGLLMGSDNIRVTAYTEMESGKGLQFVLEYYDTRKNDILWKRGYWYFSFNWIGLEKAQL